MPPMEPSSGAMSPPLQRSVARPAAALGLSALVLYVATLCPTIYAADSGQLAGAALTFGVAHPPGYPLQTLLGNLWSRVLPVGDPAWRINLISALSAAGAVALVFVLTARLSAGRVGAAFAAATLALGATFWSQALVTEVYAFDLLLASACLLAALCARRRPTRSRVASTLALVALWIGHRNLNLLYAPAVLALLWPALRPRLAHPRDAAALAGASLAPFLVLLYVPIASSFDPLIDAGDPERWGRWWAVLTAAEFHGLLFAGDFFRQAGEVLAHLPRDLGAALLLAPAGLLLLWKRAPTTAVVFGTLALLPLLFASAYSVGDRIVFALPAILAVAVLGGVAAGALAGRLPRPAGVGLLALPLLLAGWNLEDNDLRGQTLARDFAHDSLSLLAEDALVLAHSDFVAFPIWYAQAVEGRRTDVIVVSRGRPRDWHVEQTRERRPDLIIPGGFRPMAAHLWMVALLERNRDRVPIYTTTNMASVFLPRQAGRSQRSSPRSPPAC